MRVGDIANEGAVRYGKPLDGVRILALEQMQALPFATQLLARLGADVVKVEHPIEGESGRGALPAMIDRAGRRAGATFVRNNLDKRSLGIDLKQPDGQALVRRLAPQFDVFAENFKAGTLRKLGLGYDDIAKVHPSVVYLSVSGFGNTTESPYDAWPAYAPIAEAMSGLYEYKRVDDQPPLVGPAGALGDISSSLFGTIGVLAALRQRDRTGEGQYIDIAMYDAMISMSDLVVNFWSMGLRPGGLGPLLIMDGFRASDGWFIVQVGREHQFERLAHIVGHPEWLDDERFATREGWRVHLEDVIRPAIESWAAGKTKLAASDELARAGIAAGPSNTAPDVINDPHVATRNMLVELARTDGVDEPVLIPGNPIKMSKSAEGPETEPPCIGEHTEAVLRAELGVTDTELANLRASGTIA
ncbi:MAG: putative acyl-CoA transferase/carnitine dehydratase [Actinomycetia bacterium]|nr:putative acyl-CoA transferase/carnitine dehydratase [Actinomycetes bacterium]